MTAAERQRLKHLVDELQRSKLEQQRAAARGKPCAGCGGNRDRYTDGLSDVPGPQERQGFAGA
jgi:hypothetical protein